jgi:hypothetical protein
MGRCNNCYGEQRFNCDMITAINVSLTAGVSQLGDELVYQGMIEKGLELKTSVRSLGIEMLGVRLSMIDCELTGAALEERFDQEIAVISLKMDLQGE